MRPNPQPPPFREGESERKHRVLAGEVLAMSRREMPAERMRESWWCSTTGRAARPALIRLARRSQNVKSGQRASHLLSQKKAREGTDKTGAIRAPSPMSPLSLVREGGWRSSRSVVGRQLCQPGESRARCAPGGGVPPMRPNPAPLPFREGEPERKHRVLAGGVLSMSRRGMPAEPRRESWWCSTTVGRGRPPALISPSRFSHRSHRENRAGQLLSQKKAREATEMRLTAMKREPL